MVKLCCCVIIASERKQWNEDTATTQRRIQSQSGSGSHQRRTHLNEIAADYELHPVQVQQWKKLALEGMASVFGSKKDQAATDHEALTAQLYQQIGQLKVEVDWLKKKSDQLRSR